MQKTTHILPFGSWCLLESDLLQPKFGLHQYMLQHQSHWWGGECLAVVVRLPKVVYDLASLAALAHSQEMTKAHFNLLKHNSSSLCQMFASGELSTLSVLQATSHGLDELFSGILSLPVLTCFQISNSSINFMFSASSHSVRLHLTQSTALTQQQ